MAILNRLNRKPIVGHAQPPRPPHDGKVFQSTLIGRHKKSLQEAEKDVEQREARRTDVLKMGVGPIALGPGIGG